MEVYASLALCVALGHHSNLLFICHQQASSLLKCADICSRYHPLSQGFVSSRVSKNGCCCFRRNEEEEAQTPPPFDRNDRLCLFQGVINADCSDDAECLLPNTTCFKGRCLCTPGYSYLPTQHTCVRHCEVYGNTTLVYRELAIKQRNEHKLVVKNVPGRILLGRCMEFCFSFPRCRSVDVGRAMGECLVQYVGYLDVTEEERQVEIHEWSFLARNCLQ